MVEVINPELYLVCTGEHGTYGDERAEEYTKIFTDRPEADAYYKKLLKELENEAEKEMAEEDEFVEEQNIRTGEILGYNDGFRIYEEKEKG